jgi:hypothetical protein
MAKPGKMGLLDGKKGYQPPYPGHKAMQSICENTGKNTASIVGGKKTTEGRKPPLKGDDKHGDRGYKAAKVKGSK